MMLLDKGYFDYDFEKVEAPEPIIDWEDTVLDEEETANVVAMFGIGRRKKPETIEEIQTYLIKEEGYGK
jgi:hypothetical protein